MKSVNLVPRYRLAARARRNRVLKWAFGLGVYSLLLLLSHWAAVRHAAANTGPVEVRLRDTSRRIDASDRMIDAVSKELDTAQQKLRTAQAAGQQPDWSRLLTILSNATSDSMVLDLCRLRREQAGASAGAMFLDLSGFAKAQDDLSSYVLRLEKTGLFDKVRLTKSSRQDYLNTKAVAFWLECAFRTPQGQKQ